MEQFKDDFSVHEASCGPVSSFHDRACEVFAQIKGTQVDYGKKHSSDAGHEQTSNNFKGNALVPDWSEENPVILIGHSAGVQTCMQLRQLLAKNFGVAGRTRGGWKPFKNKGSRAPKRGRKRLNYQAPCREHPHTSAAIENTPIPVNHLEAFKASLRRRCAAYRRKTHTYAKKKKRLKPSLDVYGILHNFVRVHFTTK